MRAIWDGTGEVSGEAYYTTRDGTIRGRPYVRRRVQAYLSRWRTVFTASEKSRAIQATVDNDAWMAQRNGYLVSAICHDVERALLDFHGGHLLAPTPLEQE